MSSTSLIDGRDFSYELELIKFYRQHPVLAAMDLLNTDFDIPQRPVFEDMWFKNSVILTAGRGTGKSFMCATLACLYALLYPGQKVGLLAPSFRQAKNLFSEVDSCWQRAPLLQEATKSRPIRASDRCYLEFRQAGFNRSSLIEAIPLGDGSKIRGARYYLIVADEFVHIPEKIYDTVIVPMGATTASPMENVRRMARERELRDQGVELEPFKSLDNKLIMVSSAFYKFNHMYSKIQKYREMIDAGEDKYAVHSISFRKMSAGFLSDDNIKAAYASLSSLEFGMEYEARWESDSAGVFKASLFERCRQLSDHSISLSGKPGSNYVLGVDPARVSDAYALVLVELGNPNKLVAAWEYYKNVFPQMAQTVIDICDRFNVVAINMDAGAGGGGSAIKDLLEEEERWGSKRIIDVDDDSKRDWEGRHILHMFQPSPRSNAEAVYACLNLLEKGSLALPHRPQPNGSSEEAFRSLDEAEKVYDTVATVIRQAMLIEVTETKSGIAHFDVPTGGGHSSQKKDLFTAFVLACKQIHDLTQGDDEGEILGVGIIENRPDYSISFRQPAAYNNLGVIPAPVNSWAFRKTFPPGR